jgi:hypothetical protein
MSLLSAVSGIFGGSSVGLTPAVQPFSEPADLVNQPSGETVATRFPGAVTSSHDDAGSGPVNAQAQQAVYGAEPFTEPVSDDMGAPGPAGDTAWLYGHDAPYTDWESAYGGPFVPSGPVPLGLHGIDTGGVFEREHSVPPDMGVLVRHTGVYPTTDRLASTQSEIDQTASAGRVNFDQAQYANANATGPWWIGYAENPIYNNTAQVAMPVDPTGSIYTPAGALPDMSVYMQGSAAYEEPPAPSVQYASAPPEPTNPYEVL